jgi:hypothetical protein
VVDDPRKPPSPNAKYSRRAGTVHHGDRNENRAHIPTPPTGVGLTRPPLNAPIVPPAIVPRGEFDFDQNTPPAMDPDTYHALQTVRAEVLNVVTPILALVEAREKREAEERDKRAERRAKLVVPVITALGVAIAAIAAAILHGCGS